MCSGSGDRGQSFSVTGEPQESVGRLGRSRRELRQPLQTGVEFPVGTATLPTRIKTVLTAITAAGAHIAMIGIAGQCLIVLHDDPSAAVALQTAARSQCASEPGQALQVDLLRRLRLTGECVPVAIDGT